MPSYFSRVRLCAIPWTLACEAPLSMEFSRQEYWSGLLCPTHICKIKKYKTAKDMKIEYRLWQKYPYYKHKMKVTQSCLTLWPHRLYSPWNSLGQNTGVSSLSLLQGIFPTQGSNPGLPHCRQILYQLSHRGSLRILEWVNYPFSRGSSRPRNQTGVSCTAGGFFTNWAIREAHGVLTVGQRQF